jgi:1-acyl-sn-glycerol-3-phosphate acyltransferase
MLNRTFAILWLIFVSTTSIFFYIAALITRVLTYPFDKKLKALHLLTCFWGSLYTWITPPWRIKTYGREKICKGATYVVVSNHQSQLDILVAFRLFFHFKWVSKIEIFKVPLIGWNMFLNRYIKLVRGDKESIQKMMDKSREHLAEGSSVYFFPEGTRSFDGKIKPFKPGAFILAKEMKLPILPIVISGTNKALPKYSMNLHGIQKIIIKVYDEIPYSRFENLTVEETADMVQSFISKELDTLNEITLK